MMESKEVTIESASGKFEDDLGRLLDMSEGSEEDKDYIYSIYMDEFDNGYMQSTNIMKINASMRTLIELGPYFSELAEVMNELSKGEDTNYILSDGRRIYVLNRLTDEFLDVTDKDTGFPYDPLVIWAGINK